MKIFVNEFHEIKAIDVNDTDDDTLKEYEISDGLLSHWCSTVIKSFCYQVNDDGSIALYPYKDFSLLISIQDQNDIREIQLTETVKQQVELNFRVTMLEMSPAAKSTLK